jgi:hypothetical protein
MACYRDIFTFYRMGPARLGTKNHCAAEGQQQFSSQS